jgi:NADH-quinone oxidoreductase subunit C
MSKAVLERLKSQFGDRILETSDFRGDEEALVSPKDWFEIAQFLRDDRDLKMDHFVDVTAVDYPEREPDLPRFDVLLMVRSLERKHRVRLKTRVEDEEELDSVTGIWMGANWAEREVYDMFGIVFRGHPDLRRILMYPEFEGHPLRKDYPIERAQPLVPYREVEGIEKLPPFGVEEGQPWGRISWERRLRGEEHQTSPAIAYQTGQRRMLSDTDAYNLIKQRIASTSGKEGPANPPYADQDTEEEEG